MNLNPASLFGQTTRFRSFTGAGALAAGVFFAGVFFAWSSLPSCGGDGGSPTPVDFCQQKSQHECESVKTVCAFTTTSACEATRKAQCVQDTAALTVGTHAFRQGNVKACLDAIDRTYTTTVTAAAWTATRATCARVFEGTGPNLAPCAVDSDCSSPLICDPAKLVCSAPHPVAAGAACSNPGEICPTGQYCAKESTFYMCTTKVPLGAACNAAIPCDATGRCVGSVCTAAIPENAVCAQDSDCGTGFCDPFSRVCTTGIGFAIGSNSCRAFAGQSIDVPDAGVDASGID